MTGLALNGGDPIIHYDTTGGGRNIIQTWGDGKVKLDYHPSVDNPNPSLLDRFGRIKTMDIRKITGETTSTIHKYEYGHDANGNRTYALIEQAGHPGDRSYLYGYDRLNRLIYAERGVLNGTNDGILDGGKGRAWGLDLLGNWSGDLDAGAIGNQSVVDYTTQTSAPPDHGYTQGTDVPDAFTHHNTDQVNRITSRIVDDTPGDGTVPSGIPFVHDAAGNLTDDGDRTYVYDAWNRIVEAKAAGTTIAKYTYDAIGRKITATIGTGPTPTDYYYYDGHRDLEHYKYDGQTLSFDRVYIYGPDYIDEVIAYFELSGVPHFVLQDANYNVVGVVDLNGNLQQQYGYKPYGGRLFAENGSGASIDFENFPDQILISKGHQGLHHMLEIDGVYNRGRIYFPSLGRFGQRDPNKTALLHMEVMLRNAQSPLALVMASARTQYADGMSLYHYAGSNPVTLRDPTGLEITLTARMAYTAAATTLAAALFGAAIHAQLQSASSLQSLNVAWTNRIEQNLKAVGEYFGGAYQRAEELFLLGATLVLAMDAADAAELVERAKGMIENIRPRAERGISVIHAAAQIEKMIQELIDAEFLEEALELLSELHALADWQAEMIRETHPEWKNDKSEDYAQRLLEWLAELSLQILQ